MEKMKIHIAGIGGEGWSWIAKVLLEKGHLISGCNLDENTHVKFLKQIGLQDFELGNSTDHVSKDLDYFLYTSAILSNPENKKELDYAKELGIKSLDRNEFLPVLLNDREVIAVAGTHGKTTTSALVTYLLDSLGNKCGFGVGGNLKNYNTNGRNGDSNTFVIEADEFADAFLGLHPIASIITNLEMDHHDYFKNFESYKKSFSTFIDQTEKFLVIFGDDKNLLELGEFSTKQTFKYGEDDHNDYRIKNIRIENFSTKWQLKFEDQSYDIEIPFPGKQYAYNATAAIIMCHKLGYDIDTAISFLKSFEGTDRRFEMKKIKDVLIVNDYGHHPTEIKVTLQGALNNDLDKKKKVIVVYEPHQYKRCAELLDDFKGIFQGADLLIQTSIFASRELPPYLISNESFFSVTSEGVNESIYVEDWQKCSELVLSKLKDGEEAVVLIFAVGHGSQISAQLEKDFFENKRNKRVLIMGLGVHGGGVAAARFFAEKGSDVLVTDLKNEADLLPSLEKLKEYPNIKYVLGEHREEDFRNTDLVIRNPGVPRESKFLKVAYDAGVEVQMQEGIFFQNCVSKNIIGVTGTKGKTTTAYLIYECLKANGVKAILAGNMRKPVLDILEDIKEDDWVVLELSSWQCEALDDNQISPHISVVTNISEDHLNRYSSYKDYALSKASIFKYQNKNDLCFLNKDIEFLNDYKFLCKSNLFEVDTNSFEKIKDYDLEKTHLKGIHNLKNIVMVLNVCEKLNMDLNKCALAIKEFKGVPYRLEKIGSIKEVAFINDSAATTVAATLSGIEAYKDMNPVLILGGADKQLDYEVLAKEIINNKLNYVLLKGTATEKLVNAGLNSSIIFDNFYEAIESAYLKAKDIKGVVLLSPGAASFGMFKHEFDRGDKFKNIYIELKVKYEDIFFTTDSRKVKENSLFIAYKGANSDAHAYIEAAINSGAKYIAGEKFIEEIDVLKKYPEVIYSQISDGRELYAELCAQQFGFPQKKLKVIGITGTDGKTTTSTFIYNILKNAGKKCGLISTVAAYYNDKDISTGLHTTTPDADLLFKIIKDMVDDGVEYLVLEITSHGLIQKRVHGIHLVASGVTNITPEHLDAHGTYEQLIKDKAKIFNISDAVFLNIHGKSFEQIKKYVPQNISLTEVDSKIVLSDILPQNFSEDYPGDYNLQNAALAVSITRSLDISDEIIKQGIEKATPPTGRFERIQNNKEINLIVDFAHTENSMRNVLSSVKKLKKDSEKIIVVFGCAGERDKQKRPQMGKTASELADIVILTAEDPRSEKVESIIKEISLGNADYEFIKVSDRSEAIKKSLELASKNDWVLILGKGHEQSMNFNGTELPWSDIDAARNIFNA